MSKLAHSNQETMDEIEARSLLMNNESNEFAMHLLMPTEFVRAELEKFGGFDIEDEKAVQRLANKFRVSKQVMTLRLGQVLGMSRSKLARKR